MTRLRIVVVVPGFPVERDEPGLAAVVDLVERIGRVHDCRVVALRHPPAGRPYTVAGVRVTALGVGTSGGARGRAAVLARGVRAVMSLHRRAPVDLVHGLWLDEPGAVAALAGRLIRRPVLASVMGGELVALQDIGYGAALGRGGRWTTALALRAADLVTAGASPVLAAVEARRRGPVALLPLGVDLATFRPPEGGGPAPAADAARTILWVGGLEPVKDPAAMLGAFARLAPERPELRLEMVGDGALRPFLEGEVGRLGLAGRVGFPGQVARSTMPDRYRGAALLAVTSRHEGQSMVAVEAAACGLPVVGTRVGVLPDLSDAALTVPVGDEQALASAIAAVLDDPVRMAAMGQAARHIAETRFDLDATSAALFDRYEALVRRGVAPASER